jgi:hypothetical protein
VSNDAALTAGGWELGTPIGTVNGTNASSPASDATAAPGTKCWTTGLGVAGGTAASQDIDGGTSTLTSPVFNLGSASGATLTVSLWFYCSDIPATPAEADSLRIEVSNGGAWTLVDDVRTNVNTAWSTRSYELGDFVAITPTLSVRFITGDRPENSTTEAAIDEFVVYARNCVTAQPCPGDLDHDGNVGGGDLSTLLGAWGTAKVDLDGDGVCGGGDLSIMLGSWGACP